MEEIKIPYNRTFLPGTLYNFSSDTLIITVPGWLMTRNRREVKHAVKFLDPTGPSFFMYDSLSYLTKNIFLYIAPLYRNELLQLETVINFFQKEKLYKHIIIEGVSLGALIGSIAVTKYKVDGLITINGFFDYKDYLIHHPFMNKLSFSFFYKKRSLQNIQFIHDNFHPEKIAVPTLVVQGRSDTFISPNTAIDFYEQLITKDKQLTLIKNADHFLSGEAVLETRDHVLRWVKQHGW